MYRRSAAALTLFAAILAAAGCDQEASAPQAMVAATGRCSLDRINGQGDTVVHAKAGIVEFGGWSLDSDNGIPETLQLFLKDSGGFSYFIDVAQRHDRPDVARHFKREELLKSGFSVKADLSSLKPGAYAIALKMPDKGRMAICRITKNLIIE